jgi:hypothetical protein
MEPKKEAQQTLPEGNARGTPLLSVPTISRFSTVVENGKYHNPFNTQLK